MRTLKHVRFFVLLSLIVLAAIAIPFARAQAMSDVACDTTALVNAIQNAVNAGGTQSLSLAGNCTYTLTVVNNGAGSRDANGLPVIANNVNLTIVGNGATIRRDASAPQFRILQIAQGSILNISAVTIRGGRGVDGTQNHLPGSGGGISNDGMLNISNSNILENHAGEGGKPNQGGAVGGGISNSGTLVMTHTNVVRNVSGNGADGEIGATGGDGGGIYNDGSATITNSAIYGNKSGAGGDGTRSNGGRAGYGAGIMHYEGQLILANSTVSGNKTGKGGKGITGSFPAGSGGGLAAMKGNVIITNSTIAKNKSGPNGIGSGIYAYGTVKLRNTILADNTPRGNCFGVPSKIKNVTNNLDTGTSCGFGSANGSQSNADPNLQKLADNGGFTLTHAIKKPSDAFNKGKDAVCDADPINNQDQRGMTRSQGKHCDIGAFELQVSQPTPTATHTPTRTDTPPPSTATSTPTLTPSPTPTQPAGACAGPSNGRVSCWQGENDANDSVGTNNGTVQGGATYATGKVGQAFSFDGVNDYMQVADHLSLRPTQLTVAGWFNAAAFTDQPGGNAIIAHGASGSGTLGQYGNSYFLGFYQSKPQFETFTTVTGAHSSFGPDVIPTGQWHHLAATIENGAKKLYLDGALIASDTVSGSLVYETPIPVTIGQDWNIGAPSNNVMFNGLIDEVQVWNRALTAQEILALYNAQ